MKLELSFSCVTDLTNQLQDLLEDLKGNDVQRAAVIQIGGTVTPIEPVITPIEQIEAEPVVATAEAPKKRTRRTKKQIEAEKTKPVETASVVEQPTLSVTVENMVNVLSDMVAENPSIPLAPKNFYSLSEFSVNFAIVLNTLLNDGSLNIGDLETACKYYDVKNIYLISKDIAMMEHYYNDLVSRQIITKKGDY